MFDLIELQRELMEAQGQDPDRKIKARIAKIQQRKEDIKLLSEHSNLCPAGIADTLSLPVSYVQTEIDNNNIDRDNKLKRQLDILTGHIDPYEGASISIFK